MMKTYKMVSTNFVTDSIFVCYRCKKMQVITGKGCWMNPGELIPGAEKMIFTAIVNCYKCFTTHGPTGSKENSYVYQKTIQAEYENTHTLVSKFVGKPAVWHMVLVNEIPGSTGYTTYGKDDEVEARCPIMVAHSIPKTLEYEHTVKTLNDNGLTDAEVGFFTRGILPNRRYRFLPTPFMVYMVLFCPICTRNFIYKGPGTFMGVGTRVLTRRDMAQLFFVCCTKCRSVKGYSDQDASIHVARLGLVNDTSIRNVRNALPVPMDIFGASLEPENSQYDLGKIAIMHLDRIVETVTDFCTTHSVFGGSVTSPVTDFI